MKAILRSIRISPKKVNLVAKLVRGKPVEWAINFLKFTPKKSAIALMNTIKSAAANAEENFKQKRTDLFINSIIINEGFTLKRARPVSRGRSHPIKKRTTHITVEVAVRPGLSTASKMATQEIEKPAKSASPEKSAEDNAKQAPVKTVVKKAPKKTAPKKKAE